MKYNYYNPISRQYGYIEKSSHFAFQYKCENAVMGVAKSFDEANAVMESHGYERMGVVDESGCRRYTLTLPQLQGLYKQFEEFVADCTKEEYNENKSAITAVYTLIHKHINAETMK